MAAPLAIKILATPTQLSMAERSTFVVGVEVANQGQVATDPQLANTCELAINGDTSVAWNLAFGTIKRDERWSMLPPGQSVSVQRQLGMWLFPRPGTYRLVLTVGGQEVATDVQVTQ